MKNNIKILGFAVLISCVSAFLGVICGFFIGKSHTSEPTEVIKEVVKWEKLPADTIKIVHPEPYKVYDTIINLQTIYVDTAKFIEDYYKIKNYRLDFSNDTLGKFIVETKVHQNNLTYAEAQIEPIIKIVTITETKYKVKTLRGYVMLGSSIDLRCNQIQAGADILDRYMLGVSGLRLGDKLGYTLNFGVKF